MNDEELRDEFSYRIAERFGIMCGTDEPTDEQRVIAIKEAKASCDELRMISVSPPAN